MIRVRDQFPAAGLLLTLALSGCTTIDKPSPSNVATSQARGPASTASAEVISADAGVSALTPGDEAAFAAATTFPQDMPEPGIATAEVQPVDSPAGKPNGGGHEQKASKPKAMNFAGGTTVDVAGGSSGEDAGSQLAEASRRARGEAAEASSSSNVVAISGPSASPSPAFVPPSAPVAQAVAAVAPTVASPVDDFQQAVASLSSGAPPLPVLPPSAQVAASAQPAAHINAMPSAAIDPRLLRSAVSLPQPPAPRSIVMLSGPAAMVAPPQATAPARPAVTAVPEPAEVKPAVEARKPPKRF